MEEIKINDKEKYLDENCPFINVPKLNETKYCLHCGELISVGDYKVVRDFNVKLGEDFDYISCPNHPKCDGTIIDWMPPEWKD